MLTYNDIPTLVYGGMTTASLLYLAVADRNDR